MKLVGFYHKGVLEAWGAFDISDPEGEFGIRYTLFNNSSPSATCNIFGEQIASNLGREWMSAVRVDLESCLRGRRFTGFNESKEQQCDRWLAEAKAKCS